MKLHELFVRWIVKPENNAMLTKLLDDVRSGGHAAIPQTPTPPATPTTPGSPVSRLITSQLPFGGSPRYHKHLASSLSTPAPAAAAAAALQAQATPSGPLSMFGDLDLGRSSISMQGAARAGAEAGAVADARNAGDSPTRTPPVDPANDATNTVVTAAGSTTSPAEATQTPEGHATKSAHVSGEGERMGPNALTEAMNSSAARSGEANSDPRSMDAAPFDAKASEESSIAAAASSDAMAVDDGQAATAMARVAAESDVNRDGRKQDSGDAMQSVSASSDIRRAAERGRDDAVVPGGAGGQNSQLSEPRRSETGNEAPLSASEDMVVPEKGSVRSETDEFDRPTVVVDNQMSPMVSAHDTVIEPTAALPPSSPCVRNGEHTDWNKAGGKQKKIPRFYFPLGKGAEDRETREWAAIGAMFASLRDAKGGAEGVSRAEFTEIVHQTAGLPRFFAPLVYDQVLAGSVVPPADVTSSATNASSATRAQGNGFADENAQRMEMSVGSAEAVHEATGEQGAAVGSIASTTDGNGDETMADDARAPDARAHPLSETTDPFGAQSQPGTATSSDDTQMQAEAESGGGEMSTESAGPLGNSEGDRSQAHLPGVDVSGASTPMVVDAGSTQSTAPLQTTTATVGLVTEERYREYYTRVCKTRSREERMFLVLRDANTSRDYLVPGDFKPLLKSLLMCHQGLAFLHATPEFQLRYSETVIERIYFSCTRKHNGRLYMDDIKRSRLLDTLAMVDEEEDINRERRYFSYEHFYVLYCRFWELDNDHDLQINREDLVRYGGHSLTYRIVDRIFGGYARPLDNPDHPGFMSYTDFIWFCLSEEDKTSETAIDYWYRCVDMDGDGLITMYDMEFFYKEQLHRMECFGHEPVQVRDIVCQLLDMVKPNAKPPQIKRSDLKSCRLAGNFFNILFNLNKFFALEARDPNAIRQEHATPELTDWDRFAALEYLRLSAEEEGEEDESWEEVGEVANPLIVGEAPF